MVKSIDSVKVRLTELGKEKFQIFEEIIYS